MYSQPEPGLRSRAPIALAALGWAAAAPALAAEIAVDCGAGGTITEALKKAATGDRITSNTGTGILVDRGSQADVAANDISGNGANGITVSRNSGVAFHSTGTERPEAGNTGTAPNAGLGVHCALGGYVEGPLGTLRGEKGTVAVQAGCIDGTEAGTRVPDRQNAGQAAASSQKAGKE